MGRGVIAPLCGAGELAAAAGMDGALPPKIRRRFGLIWSAANGSVECEVMAFTPAVKAGLPVYGKGAVKRG